MYIITIDYLIIALYCLALVADHRQQLVQGVLQCGLCTAPAESASTPGRLRHQLSTVMFIQLQ